jgi:UDP-3-O-[3-hydroxymyristoyl] glucosamine N-acyltransferase
VEQLQQQNKDWLSQYQYIMLGSDIALKISAVEYLDSQGVDWFSLIHDTSHTINPDVKIGRGTLVSSWVDLLCGVIDIGDHVILSSFIQFGHYVTLENFCHVSAYCFLNNTRIGQGTVIGLRSSIMNRTGTTIIPNYTNILSGSTIYDSLSESGTYNGRRRIDDRTSLEHRIL